MSLKLKDEVLQMPNQVCVFCKETCDPECPEYGLGRCCRHHSHFGCWEGSLEEYVELYYDPVKGIWTR